MTDNALDNCMFCGEELLEGDDFYRLGDGSPYRHACKGCVMDISGYELKKEQEERHLDAMADEAYEAYAEELVLATLFD